jgi:xanthine dehydrogenase/oxidase
MRDFFLGYRKIDLKPDELIVRVKVPLPGSKCEIFRAYKQAKRKDDDIAITNGGFRVVLEEIDHRFFIKELDLSLGGVAPTTLYLKKLALQAKNLEWAKESNLKRIQELILDEVNFSYSVPGE